jgi:hypothetical protein
MQSRLYTLPDDPAMCPLSGVRMKDPVVLGDGISYERQAAEHYLSDPHNTHSPVTGDLLKEYYGARLCFHNFALKGLLEKPSSDLNCPILFAPLEYPVLFNDGHTYDRRAMKGFFKIGKRGEVEVEVSPITRDPIYYEMRVPNKTLSRFIKQRLGHDQVPDHTPRVSPVSSYSAVSFRLHRYSPIASLRLPTPPVAMTRDQEEAMGKFHEMLRPYSENRFEGALSDLQFATARSLLESFPLKEKDSDSAALYALSSRSEDLQTAYYLYKTMLADPLSYRFIGDFRCDADCFANFLSSCRFSTVVFGGDPVVAEITGLLEANTYYQKRIEYGGNRSEELLRIFNNIIRLCNLTKNPITYIEQAVHIALNERCEAPVQSMKQDILSVLGKMRDDVSVNVRLDCYFACNDLLSNDCSYQEAYTECLLDYVERGHNSLEDKRTALQEVTRKIAFIQLMSSEDSSHLVQRHARLLNSINYSVGGRPRQRQRLFDNSMPVSRERDTRRTVLVR